MQIDLNENSLKALSTNLRNALIATWGPQSIVPNSLSRELLAKTLGFKNWDTLSGVVQKEAKKASKQVTAQTKVLETFKPFILYIDAFACDEYGEGPVWAKVNVTPAFVKELLNAQALTVSKKMDYVALGFGPDDWGNSDALRIRGEELGVSPQSFWFRGYPEHCNYAVESRMMDINLLLGAITDARKHCNSFCAFADDVLFYGANGAQEFARQLLDDLVIDVNEGTIDQMPS